MTILHISMVSRQNLNIRKLCVLCPFKLVLILVANIILSFFSLWCLKCNIFRIFHKNLEALILRCKKRMPSFYKKNFMNERFLYVNLVTVSMGNIAENTVGGNFALLYSTYGYVDGFLAWRLAGQVHQKHFYLIQDQICSTGQDHTYSTCSTEQFRLIAAQLNSSGS